MTMKKENATIVKSCDYPNINLCIKTSFQTYSTLPMPNGKRTEYRCKLIIFSSYTGEILFTGEFTQNKFHTVYIDTTVQAIVSNDISTTDDAYREAARLYTLIIDTTERENKYIVFIP